MNWAMAKTMTMKPARLFTDSPIIFTATLPLVILPLLIPKVRPTVRKKKKRIGTMPRISGELRMVPVFGFRSRAPSGTIMKSRTPMKSSVAQPVAFKALISRSVQGSSEKLC